jgi:hypothetical protein
MLAHGSAVGVGGAFWLIKSLIHAIDYFPDTGYVIIPLRND